MPILQNRLVMKSIEALHDEALALMPDIASYSSVTSPPAISHATKPLKEPPLNAPKGTSADAPLETASGHDIMDRIDHLLRRIDEDDNVAIALPPKKGPQSYVENMTGDASDGHTNNASDDKFSDDQQGKTVPSNQTQALANIAEAIYEARHQAVDAVVANTSQNSAAPFDINVLSATLADEVRRTLSAIMIEELPRVVRDAVGEAIRALPATENPSTTKGVAARKTAVIRKAGGKKAGTKKTVAKKTSGKTAAKKKLSVKKPRPNKVEAKKTTDKKTAPAT